MTDGRPFTVLVVDDEPDILTSLTDLLETSLPGIHVLQAASGDEGIDRLHEARVDLILTDFRMPGINGLQFLEQAALVAPHAPAIMITAYPDLDVVLAAVNERRARGFIVKPVDPSKLIACVEDTLLARQANELRDRALVAVLRGDA